LGAQASTSLWGAFFESSINDAADEIIKKRNGLYLQSTEWVTDESLQKSKAQTEFQKGNCKALRYRDDFMKRTVGLSTLTPNKAHRLGNALGNNPPPSSGRKLIEKHIEECGP